jgi:hypothetical protein
MYKLPALLIAASLVLSATSWSQKKLTLSAFTGSGISFFGGPGAVNKSTYHLNNTPGIPFPHPFTPDTMANPYGRKPYTNFLAGLQVDITLSSKWILQLSAQYENIGGKSNADSVIAPSWSIKTDGKYSRNYDYISFNPQIGRIILKKTVTILLHTGIDYTSKLAMGSQFDYTDQSGQRYSVGYSGGEPEVNDLRITFGASVTRKKWSIDINYKHGLVNYWKDRPAKVYARLMHIRLLYAFWSKQI